MSLLPAATEIVAALGDERHLVGISHECDYPASVTHLPRVTTTPVDLAAPGATIDAEVRRLRHSGRPIIAIDEGSLCRLAPDLILTQDLCEVCAVGDGQVHRLVSTLDPAPRVLSLTAHDLDGIWRDISAIGAALGLDDQAKKLVVELETRLGSLGVPSPQTPPRVLCIEWLDPLYLAGHWVPQLVAAAGGMDVGAAPGSRSARADWADLSRLEPTCILVMLCGFGVERSRAELERLTHPEALELMSRVPVWILDGNAYTSRPGPRVVDGAVRMRSAFLESPLPDVLRWTPACASTV